VGRTRSWWGWGWTDEQVEGTELDGIGALLANRFGVEVSTPATPVDPRSIPLAPSRVRPPDALADLASDDAVDRVRHAHGNAFRDVVRALHGDLDSAPDLVVRPRTAREVAEVLEWCAQDGVLCVPWGGGTSVVGGVRPPEDPCISLDLERLSELTGVDEQSGTADIQGGATGPMVEEALRARGLTLRHFPQSWEFSTLGGWVATRAGGHFATGPTHIDDLVAAVRAETPSGTWSSRPLPGSGAGPSPDRWLLGSEGILGVITEATVRVQQRPASRAQATFSLPTFGHGLAAVRALVRHGLQPANCRLLDPVEAMMSGSAHPGETATLLLLGFEAPHGPLTERMQVAVELVADHGGSLRDGPTHREGDTTGASSGSAGAWRSAFLRMPYLRDGLARYGAIVETFETAVPWAGAEDVVAELRRVAEAAAREVCGAGQVAVRTTHAYPDGVAPYLSVIAPGPAMQVEGPGRGRAAADAWDEIKVAVSDAIDAAGATITHHHAVGRDHRPWYDRQRPEVFAASLRAVKAELDPAGVLNPGVLIDP
jgi:alkyldihydroxyacetonephosphate synthase